MSDTVLTLGQLMPIASRGDRASFDQIIDEWVLVGPPAAGETDEWSYRTGSLQTISTRGISRTLMIEETFVVHTLRKAKAGPFANTILIGRSASNDIRVSDRSVSKLHARFHRKPDGTFETADAGSSNGTYLNLERLAPEVKTDVQVGDSISFGNRMFYVFDPEGLYKVLTKLALN